MPDHSEPRKENETRTEVSADEARRSFGEWLGRAGFGNERITISKHGKAFAGLVSARDLERLEKLDQQEKVEQLEGAA